MHAYLLVFSMRTCYSHIIPSHSYHSFQFLGKSDDIWAEQVVEPAVEIVRSFLSQEASLVPGKEAPNSTGTRILERELWTQYVCKVSNVYLSINVNCFCWLLFFVFSPLMYHCSIELVHSLENGVVVLKLSFVVSIGLGLWG